MLPHHENEHQWSVHNCGCCIFGMHGITQIYVFITELLIRFIGKKTIYYRKNTDSKIIDIANCQTCKNKLLAVEYTILIRYYYQTANTRAIYESTDGPAG